MNILLKEATIVDKQSKHHLKKRDLLLNKGTIVAIGNSLTVPEKTKVITLPNLHISTGWLDTSVSFGEPGYEERETIDNGLATAAKSGFTHVCVNAANHPVTDHKSAVSFLQNKAAAHLTNLYVIGALTSKNEGVDLAELYDMQQQGTVAFYDYKKPIKNANLLKIALQYAQNFDGLVQSFPQDMSVAQNGVAHEHINSTKLGLKGMPVLAETLQISRDLYLLAYTGGKLHIPTISTKESVALIKEAKKKGLHVTCSVAAYNLVLTDDALASFDTNYKLNPPLRSKEDTKALIKGLKEGIIDGVTSDHDPKDIEHKRIEFDHASFGGIGLESSFGALLNATDLQTAITALTSLKPTFSIPNEKISEGETTTLTLFNPDKNWTFTENHILSTSKNAPLLNQNMKGAVYGIYSKGTLQIN